MQVTSSSSCQGRIKWRRVRGKTKLDLGARNTCGWALLCTVAAVFIGLRKIRRRVTDSAVLTQLSTRDINQKKHQSGMNRVMTGLCNRGQFSSLRLVRAAFHSLLSLGASPELFLSYRRTGPFDKPSIPTCVPRGSSATRLKRNHAALDPCALDGLPGTHSLRPWSVPQHIYGKS